MPAWAWTKSGRTPKRRKRRRLGQIKVKLPEYAGKLLAKRDYSKSSLSKALLDKGYPEDEVESWISRLETRGYINDRRFITRLIRTKMEKPPLGRELLKMQLQAYDFSPVLVEEMLDRYYPARDEKKHAMHWLDAQHIRCLGDLERKLSVLARKGFNREMLMEIREQWSALDSNGKKR